MSQGHEREQYPADAGVLPYATPLQYASSAYGDQGMWQDGDRLIVRKGLILPGQCVKCGAPATVRHAKKLVWIHPAWIALILVSWIVLLIVYFIVRKTGTVDFGLCDRHEKRRFWGVAVTWVLALSGVAALIAGIAFLADRRLDELGPPLLIACPVLLLASAVTGMTLARSIYPAKMDDHFIWLRGVNIALTGFSPAPLPPPAPPPVPMPPRD